MNFEFDTRESDSALVEGIWHTVSNSAGSFISSAENRWEMVVSRQSGKTSLVIRGPETVAKPAPIPEDAEFLGIIFKPGAFMPELPVIKLTNSELYLPEACHHSVHLCNTSIELPTFENADTFIHHLIKQDLLVYDPLVDKVLENQSVDVSLRTLQRRFLKATGMPYGIFQQIERAKLAVSLLEQGVSILDAVYDAGYADQPHLTRSLRRFVGRTPAEIIQTIAQD